MSMKLIVMKLIVRDKFLKIEELHVPRLLQSAGGHNF